MHDVAVDIGQAEVAPGVTVSELGMIEPHEVQNGRMQIVRMYRVLDSGGSVFIRDTIAKSLLDSAAS